MRMTIGKRRRLPDGREEAGGEGGDEREEDGDGEGGDWRTTCRLGGHWQRWWWWWCTARAGRSCRLLLLLPPLQRKTRRDGSIEAGRRRKRGNAVRVKIRREGEKEVQSFFLPYFLPKMRALPAYGVRKCRAVI